MIFDRLPNIRGLIIDMDGVLWLGSEPIGDLPAIFDRIKSLGLQTVLATNNATRTVGEYHEKLAGFGVHLEDWQIINSSQAAALFLNKRYPNGCRVYVVGVPSLKQTFTSAGLTVVGEHENNVQAVVASMDLTLTYEKLKRATLLISAGAEFIGTNPDPTFPTPNGLWPGSGMVVGALEIASGKKALIIGKPEPHLYEMAAKRLELKPEETLCIGDRLETDIAGAQAAGMHTALVLSGVSTIVQAQRFSPPPEIISQDLAELIF